jgi:hypothetical protein
MTSLLASEWATLEVGWWCNKIATATYIVRDMTHYYNTTTSIGWWCNKIATATYIVRDMSIKAYRDRHEHQHLLSTSAHIQKYPPPINLKQGLILISLSQNLLSASCARCVVLFSLQPRINPSPPREEDSFVAANPVCCKNPTSQKRDCGWSTIMAFFAVPCLLLLMAAAGNSSLMTDDCIAVVCCIPHVVCCIAVKSV